MGSPSYWMANLLELVAILETAQNERDRQQSQRNIHRTSTDTERVVTKFRHDLEYIVIEIYYQWLKELKKEVGKMVVPAVVEHQGLPGFIEDDRGGSAGFLNKLIGSSSGSPMPTEKLLAWLSRLLTVMEYNLVDTTIQ